MQSPAQSGHVALAGRVVQAEPAPVGAALRIREVEYRALFEASRDALMTLVAPTWQLVSGNPAAIALFGARDDLDFVSRSPWQYAPELQPDGRVSEEKARAMFETALREGSHDFEWTCKRSTGETFPATVTLSRLCIDGQTLLHATVRDESERQRDQNELRRAKEEAESATRVKSELLANMSCELRTPMNAVVGLTHLLLKTELTARQRSLLAKVQLSADGMVGLISNISDYSKIERGQLEIEAVEFAIDRLLENVESVLFTKAAEKHLALRFHVADDVPPTVVGDPLRLGQILLNLAGNAVKFTAQGEVVISVVLAAPAARTARLRFAVRDTGPGIPAERQGFVFDPFVQVDGSITRRFGGPGLGLAISRQLVEMMGGSLSLDSKEGRGSTFAFTVSVGLGAGARQRRHRLCFEDAARMRVLVADDTLTGREILRAHLTGMSFSVHTVDSGEAALEELQNGQPPYDLVLLDWCMPGMDGPEVARWIKRSSVGVKVPRVLLVTALDPGEAVPQAIPVGVDAIVYKPVTESSLLDAIMAVSHVEPRSAEVAERRTVPASSLTADAVASERVHCLAGGMAAHVTKPSSPGHLRETSEGVPRARPEAPGSQTTVARPPLAEEGPSGSPWPDAVPGVDLTAGLRRLTGNRALYLRLLRGFADEHGTDAQRIRSALAVGDVAAARSLAHKLKGVAGNLSAKQVAVVAGRLETILRDGAVVEVGRDLEDLLEAMRVVTASVVRLDALGAPGCAPALAR